MKKFLMILVMVSWCSVGTAEVETSIKHKRIECSYSEMPERWNHSFLIISDNDKTAELITIPWGKVEKFQANITKTLMSITFNFKNRGVVGSEWIMDRRTGIIEVYVDKRFNHEKKCEPFSENFNPEEFLNNAIKSNIENIIKNNKF